MASIGNLLVRVQLMPDPRPHSLCQEWINPPPPWALPLAFLGLACAAVCCVAPQANGHAIVTTGMLFGGLATVAWECVAIGREMWRESR
jgi:hypothetical protein